MFESDLAMANPKVSIIVVTFNSADTIRCTMESILEQTFQEYEIIVLDNASKDNTLGIVAELLGGWNGRYNIIASDLNLGFAEGNNRALKNATGEYVALVNPDAVAEKNWLGNLVIEMEDSPEVGICASKIINHDSELIDSAGDGFAMSFRGFKRGEGLGPNAFCNKEYVFGACACAALYRRTMLDKIGFFDPIFFLIHEDTDLNFRAQLSGWKVLYVPSAVVYHKVRSSIGLMSDLAIYYSVRNKELLILKNGTLGLIIVCFPQIVSGMIAEFIYFVVKHRKFRVYCRAKIDVIKNAPKMWRERSLLNKIRTVRGRYLLSLLAPIWDRDYLVQKGGKLLYG